MKKISRAERIEAAEYFVKHQRPVPDWFAGFVDRLLTLPAPDGARSHCPADEACARIAAGTPTAADLHVINCPAGLSVTPSASELVKYATAVRRVLERM